MFNKRNGIQFYLFFMFSVFFSVNSVFKFAFPIYQLPISIYNNVTNTNRHKLVRRLQQTKRRWLAFALRRQCRTFQSATIKKSSRNKRIDKRKICDERMVARSIRQNAIVTIFPDWNSRGEWYCFSGIQTNGWWWRGSGCERVLADQERGDCFLESAMIKH